MLKAEEEYMLAVRWRGAAAATETGLCRPSSEAPAVGETTAQSSGKIGWWRKVPTRNRAEIQEHETRRTALGLALTVLDDRDRHIFEARLDSPIMLEQLAMTFLISREPCVGS
jgi:hypothetical protein